MNLANSEGFLSGDEFSSSCSGTLILGSRRASRYSSQSSTGSDTSIINSATFVRHSDESDIDSFINDEFAGGDIDNNSSTKIRKFFEVLTPEKLQEKKEKHEKWLKEKLARQKEQRRREQAKIELEMQKKEELEEERRQKSAESLKKWMEKKKIDANQKITRLKKAEIEFQQRQNEKKEKLAKQISFDEWMRAKSTEVKLKSPQENAKKRNDVKIEKKVDKKSPKFKGQKTSYEDWLIASKFKPKPVPLNQGLESLRGSLSKLQVNPEPWKI